SEYPGLHHAWGHDGHASALLGAAKILRAHEDKFAGTHKLDFQQAEEIGAGARQLVDGGLVEAGDEVSGLHGESSVPGGQSVPVPGATNASCDIFKINVHGKSAHVGQPHQGVDAVLAAAAITVELQSIVGREVRPLDNVVVAVGVLNAGTRYNRKS